MKYHKFINLCRKTQGELKEYVINQLEKYGYDPIAGDGYVYAKGSLEVLLTAHLDTVHKEPVKSVVIEKDVISSPQGIGGDDRCGVFIILRILKETSLRPYILFCEDEEKHGVGSSKFVKTKYCDDLYGVKFFVEIDRRGSNDAVYYSCGNDDFKKFVKETTGYKEAWGSFSDIDVLSPITDIASVNLSCGYHSEHTLNEYVVYNEMIATRNAVIKLILASLDVERFDYMEEDYYDYYYDDYGWPLKNHLRVLIVWNDDDGTAWEKTYAASSKYEAFGMFFEDFPNVTFNDVQDYDVYFI